MSETLRWSILGVALLAALVGVVLVTRHVVWGGEPTREGRVEQGVRPGAEEAAGIPVYYHYRVTSRFGEYVTARIENGRMSVAGRRLDPGGYAFFIGTLALLQALALVALVAAALWWDWRWLVGAAGLVVAYLLAVAVMAAGLWEGSGIGASVEPGTLPKVSFPVSSVRDVRVGAGWSRNGVGIVIAAFVPGIDKLAEGIAVSFEAPDPVTNRYVTYALQAYTKEEAADLAGALRGERR